MPILSPLCWPCGIGMVICLPSTTTLMGMKGMWPSVYGGILYTHQLTCWSPVHTCWSPVHTATDTLITCTNINWHADCLYRYQLTCWSPVHTSTDMLIICTHINWYADHMYTQLTRWSPVSCTHINWHTDHLYTHQLTRWSHVHTATDMLITCTNINWHAVRLYTHQLTCWSPVQISAQSQWSPVNMYD